MPDPREDYDYLYQVGENSYREPWNMRSLFGVSDPRALTSQEEVTVTAPRPGNEAPYPEHMDEVMLGTKTLPPTGTYTPPLQGPTNVDPKLQAQWAEIVKNYPFAQNFVQNVKTKNYRDNEIRGNQVGNTVNVNRNLADIGEFRIPETLAHEVTHAAQDQQFPDRARNEAQYYGKSNTYADRPGEDLARTVAQDAENKRYKEMYYEAQAKQKEDYLAGRGPKPWFMYADVIARRKAREAQDK